MACHRDCSRIFASSRAWHTSIFSDLNSYRDTGALSVYAGTSLETAEQLIRSVLEEFRRITNDPIGEEELRRAKGSPSKGAIAARAGRLGAKRMSSLARYHIYFDRHFTPQELIAMLESVTIEDIQTIAREFFQSDRLAASVVGNLNGFKLTRDQLAI